MCTAATYKIRDFYFGRVLDCEISYGETIIVTPGNFKLIFRSMGTMDHRFAFMGMAHMTKNHPLYYDVVNEKGPCIAGLSFVGNARCREKEKSKGGIAQWGFIPWTMGQCAAVNDARELLGRISFLAESFSPHFPVAQLHWIISGKNNSATVESVKDGMFVYDNSIGVLTNSPPSPFQVFNLNNYIRLSVDTPKGCFSEQIGLNVYNRGIGAIEFPGDLSSVPRFVRMTFTKMNSLSENGEESNVSQFSHILGSVEQ